MLSHLALIQFLRGHGSLEERRRLRATHERAGIEQSIFREERSLGGRSIDLDLIQERLRFARGFHYGVGFGRRPFCFSSKSKSGRLVLGASRDPRHKPTSDHATSGHHDRAGTRASGLPPCR